MYRWELATSIGGALNSGVHPVIEQILLNRGVSSREELQAFLNPTFEHEHDPFSLKGMSDAVERLNTALEQDEKVLIHGDYDADGVTAAALLSEAFSAYGLDNEVYIPTREDGYGLQREAIHMAKAQGFTLIVTVDCGITACAESELARELGIDLIITDHHTPGEDIPQATAVINPKLANCTYPYKDLAGVGVAYKLAAALLGDDARELLDLVAVGTVADLAPLTGENRLYVREGLEELGTRVGLAALMQVAGLKRERITAGNVAYTIAPRLNAAGRLQNANLPLELLLTSDIERAMDIAEQLNAFNRERQDIEQTILQEAMTMVDLTSKSIVLYAPHWPHGVVGIVASRLVERFYRPTVLLCRDESGQLRGSGRSVAGFSLVEALRKCEVYLERCGGHSMAAGLSLQEENLASFIEAFGEVTAGISEDLLVPRLRIDAELEWVDISEEFVSQLEQLAPFGMGNPQPLFAVNRAKLTDIRTVGKQNEHLRLGLVGDKGQVFSGLMFGQAARESDAKIGQTVKVAFRPTIDTYLGKRSISLRVEDFTTVRDVWLITSHIVSDRAFTLLPQSVRDMFFCPAYAFGPIVYDLHAKQVCTLTDCNEGANIVMLTPPLHQHERELVAGLNYSVDKVLVYNGKGHEPALSPERDTLALFYKHFCATKTVDLAYFAQSFSLPLGVAYGAASTAAKIFEELELLNYKYHNGFIDISLTKTKDKQDLSHSKTFLAQHAWKRWGSVDSPR